jgi:beta-lactamase class A
VSFRLNGRWFVLLLAFVLGSACLFGVQQMIAYQAACHEDYDLLNPTVLCRATKNGRSEWGYEPLRLSLVKHIDDLRTAGKIDHLSVYFRDLKNGPRFGIQEYDNFHTASLLKLPVMIAILHAVDQNPALLDEELTSPATLSVLSNVEQPDQTIQPNTKYTIRELLRRMIVYSDNDSANMLVDKVNSIPMLTHSNTFLDLGLLNMMSGTMDVLSMQSYANLFTMLYSASYLSDAQSQFALDLLSQSTYKDGLVAGVPADIRVANKFGYYIVSKEETQLHDCGIVYHPLGPYVLCVMTSGPDIKSEAASIAEISKTVYDAVSDLHL